MAYAPGSYTGNGSATDYAIPFSYISRAHVKVYVAGVSVGFTFVNSALIRTDSAPTNGAAVLVVRETETDSPVVTFQPGTIKSADLNRQNLQLLYKLQEEEYAAELATQLVGDAEDSADAAAASAAAAASSASAASTSAGAASTSATAAATAKTNAETAETHAETAETNAAASALAAAASATAASTAKTAAETAETHAETAETNSAASAALAAAYAASITSVGYLLDWGSITVAAGDPPTDYGTL